MVNERMKAYKSHDGRWLPKPNEEAYLDGTKSLILSLLFLAVEPESIF